MMFIYSVRFMGVKVLQPFKDLCLIDKDLGDLATAT